MLLTGSAKVAITYSVFMRAFFRVYSLDNPALNQAHYWLDLVAATDNL